MKLKIKRKEIPFSLTFFRLFLAIIIFFIILSGKHKISTFLFIIASFLSFFEIFIYRKKSPFKSIIDLLADKLLVNLTAIALVFRGILPLWVMIIFLGRDLLTILLGIYLFYKDLRREFKPTLLGKITFFLQIISLLPTIFGETDFVLIWAAVVLTFMSAAELIFKSEFKLIKKTDINQFRIYNLIKFSDIFTLGNVVLGLAAIFFAINKNYPFMAISLFLAAVADFFDGKLARKLNQQNVFGKELDSLADTISFGVAPAIFGFSLIQTNLAMISFTIFLFCGILRLARYNIMNVTTGYEGMPITLNGLIIPLIFLLRIPPIFYPYIYISLGILMVSNIRFRKL